VTQEIERAVEAPPAGEQIHMPGPSRLPILNAAGLAIAVVGITISLVLVIGGAVLFLVTAALWIRAASREFDELPGEHAHH
jgi:hypothetical protein